MKRGRRMSSQEDLKKCVSNNPDEEFGEINQATGSYSNEDLRCEIDSGTMMSQNDELIKQWTDKGTSSSSGCEDRNNPQNEFELLPDPGDQQVPQDPHPQDERIENGEEEEPEENNPSYCEKFGDCMRGFVNSWWMVGILCLLMGWSYAVIYTGKKNKLQCDFMGNIIDLFTFVGGTGFAASATRVFVMVVEKTCGQNNFCCVLVIAAETFCFVWSFFVLLVFFILNGDTPTSTPGPSHCDLSFYYFMVYSTWTMFVVLILLGFVYVSAYSSRLRAQSSRNIVSSSRYGAAEEIPPQERS